MTALFAGGVALVLHGALPAWVGAWLHAGFVATIAAYLLHLAQPRRSAAAEPAPDDARPAADAADDAAVSPVMAQLPAPEPQLTLPATVGDFIRASAKAQPGSHRELAVRLGTSADTVRRALAD